MTSYMRPSIYATVFRDADGQIIDYGRRWQGSPPEDTYSVDTHPERFAPIHAIADALITYLRDAYDVEVDEDVETATDLLHPAYHDVVRAVRIQPSDEACAPLTMVFTAYPGVYMHAGLLHDFHYPVCGCDACDSTWEGEVDDLEKQVFAVVTGNYSESIERGPWVSHSFTYPDGTSSGRSRAKGLPADRLKTARRILRNRAEGWAAWPRLASKS